MKKNRINLVLKNNISLMILISLIFYLLAYIINVKFDCGFWPGFLETILTTTGSIIGLSLVWELLSKKSFAEYVYSINNASTNIRDSGIINVFDQFQDIKWEDELKNVNELFAFITYGKSFLRDHGELLKKYTQKSKAIFVFPNYENEEIIDATDKLYGYGKYSDPNAYKQSTKIEIKTAISEYKSRGAEVRIYDGMLYTSFYVLDKKCILVPTKHKTEYRKVPAIEAERGGKIYEFCEIEKQYLLDHSEEVQN